MDRARVGLLNCHYACRWNVPPTRPPAGCRAVVHSKEGRGRAPQAFVSTACINEVHDFVKVHGHALWLCSSQAFLCL